MNVMKQPGPDLFYGTVPGPRAQMVRLFFDLHLYLAEDLAKILKVPGALRDVNPARQEHG